MKITVYILIAILCSNLMAQSSYPSYETIVKRFFKNYEIGNKDAKINFQKKPTGWHVSTQSYVDGQFSEVENEIFWEKNTGSYKSLKFDKRLDKDTGLVSTRQFLDAPEARLFSICPYYNYDGWDWDVIQEFGKNEDQLSDSTLYGLGRAYSSYATHLLSDQFGFGQQDNQFELERGEKLNEIQLTEFRRYQHSAIRAFTKLAERNPNFETIVGAIGVKAANEHVSSFLNLLMFSEEQEALRELKPDLYDKFYLAIAKNYLSSCAPNAVLFTGGDNDTFPILYLQAKYGFRQDVTVLVLSYLNTSRFIDLMSSDNALFKPLSFSLDKSQYDENGPNAYLPLIESINGAIDAEKYLNLINDNHQALNYQAGNQNYHIVPSRKLSLSTKAFFNETSLPASLSAYKLDASMTIPIKSGGLEMKDLALLDFLVTNDWKRPVYFNYTSLTQINLDLKDHAVLEGLCYRLLPIQKNDAVEHRIMYDNIRNKFDWNFLPPDGQVTNDMAATVAKYRSNITNLAGALLENDEREKARELLISSFSWMPENIIPLDFSNALQIKYLLELDETALAEKMADTLFESASGKLEQMDSTGNEDRNEVRINLFIIGKLIEAFDQHGTTDRIKKYQQAYDKYEALMFD